MSSQRLISFLRHARKLRTHRSPLLSAQVGDALNRRLSWSAGGPKRGDTSVLEMEIKTVPLYWRPAAINQPPSQSPGTQTSLSRGQTRRRRRTSARSGQIRADFCPYLSGITPALPISLQARAGASAFSQVSGCPALAVMTARDRIQKSFAQHPGTARGVPHQTNRQTKKAAEATRTAISFRIFLM